MKPRRILVMVIEDVITFAIGLGFFVWWLS